MEKSNPQNYYEFPYVKFHGKYYPLIPIVLKNRKKTVSTFALIDSGASISVFRPEIAEALGVIKKSKKEIRLGTANGGVDIHVVKMGIEVEDTSFSAQIGFSKKYAASFNILGRAGIFSRFSICFNEIMKTVVMVPLEKISI
ncbi:MAG: aspartyl protease family protein [Elusimicrobiota bacterium]